MSNEFGLYLGPLFGFLFTTGTLLFIIFRAPKTGTAAPATETAPAAPAPAAEAPVEQSETHS